MVLAMSLHQTAPEHSRTDWQTPDRVLELVRQMGPIGLDPCTSEDNPTAAENYFTEFHDGLGECWRGFGLIYENQPYGRTIGRWVDKAIAEMDNAPEGVDCSRDELIMLVPANTDTVWYDRAATSADARCEVRGRLTFKSAKGPAMFGSALFYWGPRAHLFCHIFSTLGRCYLR